MPSMSVEESIPSLDGGSTIKGLATRLCFWTRREHFLSCGEAKMALFDFIEVFYNQRRRHSTLGQVSPAEFERRMRTSPA